MRLYLYILLALLVSACSSQDIGGPRTCSAELSYDGASTRENVEFRFPNRNFGTTGIIPTATVQKLDLAFEDALEALPTVTVDAAILRLDGAKYYRSRGTSTTVGDLHHWASVGKVMTALGVLVLEEGGRLNLNEPISNYVSGVPDGELITLEMLLNHTSGLYSANEDPQVRTSGQMLSLDDEIAVLQRQGNLFCPGTNWRYSNSGYVLLAEVIEQVSGQSYPDFIDDHVIAKTRAHRLRAMTAGEQPDDVVALSLANGDKHEVVNHYGGAGSVIGDAESMALFIAGVFEGSVVSEMTLNRMGQRLYPMFHSVSEPSEPTRYYGLGVMVYVAKSRDRRPEYLIGHTGGLDGASAFVGWSERHQAVISVALTGSGSAEFIASKLMPALE